MLVSYTVTVANAGPNDALGVSLLNDIPAGTTFASFLAPSGWTANRPDIGGTGTVSASLVDPLASGSHAEFTLVVRVGSAAADNSIITESATVSSDTSDPNTDNQADSTTTTVRAPVTEPRVDLSVTQTASPTSATVGADDVTLTVTVTNIGPSPASNVTVSESLPPGAAFVSAPGGIEPTGGALTFVAGDLASGATATYTIVVRPQSAGTLTASASVGASEPDPNPANNRASASALAVVPSTTVPPDLIVTPTPTPVADESRLIGVRRFGMHAMPTRIVLSFSKPLEPAARRLASFRITDKKGARISIRSVVYDSTTSTIILHPSQRLSIHRPYKLIISGTRTGTHGDTASGPVAGEVKAEPGSDYTIRLTWRQLVLPSWYQQVKAAGAPVKQPHRATAPNRV